MRQPDNVIFISLVNKFVTRQGDGARACRRSFAIGFVDAYCRGVPLIGSKMGGSEGVKSKSPQKFKFCTWIDVLIDGIGDFGIGIHLRLQLAVNRA